MGGCISKTIPSIIDELENNNLNHNELTQGFNIQNVNPDDVPNVPFKDQIIDVKIIKIYDGDTVHCLVPFGNVPVKLSIRLLGIDTPELKAAKDKLPEEKIAGLICRDFLIDVLKDGAKLKINDWDKYGSRLLGDFILPNGDNVVTILIKHGYGREYHGEKKQPWTLKELTSPPFDKIPKNIDDIIE